MFNSQSLEIINTFSTLQSQLIQPNHDTPSDLFQILLNQQPKNQNLQFIELKQYRKLQILLQARQSTIRRHIQQKNKLKLKLQNLQDDNNALIKTNIEMVRQYRLKVAQLKSQNYQLKQQINKLSSQSPSNQLKYQSGKFNNLHKFNQQLNIDYNGLTKSKSKLKDRRKNINQNINSSINVIGVNLSHKYSQKFPICDKRSLTQTKNYLYTNKHNLKNHNFQKDQKIKYAGSFPINKQDNRNKIKSSAHKSWAKLQKQKKSKIFQNIKQSLQPRSNLEFVINKQLYNLDQSQTIQNKRHSLKFNFDMKSNSYSNSRLINLIQS